MKKNSPMVKHGKKRLNFLLLDTMKKRMLPSHHPIMKKNFTMVRHGMKKLNFPMLDTMKNKSFPNMMGKRSPLCIM